MFQVRDYSVFSPSPNAERAFRRQRQLDLLVRGLIALLVLLCIWNIVELVHLRLIENQDLAAVRSISDDPSTRLIWILSLVTAGVVVAREWLFGENTATGILIPVSILLGIVLVPAAMSELQPVLKDQTVQIVMHQCPPKSIVNGQLSSIGRCDPREIAPGDILLASSNPTEGSFTTIDPVSDGQNTITFNVSGRGTYTVYIMVRFDDLGACQHEPVFQRSDGYPQMGPACMEYQGQAWQVLPHTTSANQPKSMNLIQVNLP